ncbi:hypothetical protein ACIPUD_20010 [Bradyrhizobium sp. CAR08]
MTTDSTDFRPTRSWVAAEISHLRDGFEVLRRLLYDLRETEEEITTEMVNRLLWTADHVKAELEEALGHADELVDDERAEVAARRSVVVLQAAE